MAIVFAACKQSQPASLNEKKIELDSLVKVQTELNSKVSKLRNEIDDLDTTAKNLKKIKSVEVTKAMLQEFRHYIDATAVVESDQNTMVTAKVIGFVVNNVLVKVGDNVSAGQILCTVDNSSLQQSIEASKVQYSLAKTAYERRRNLWEKQIGSELEYLQAKTLKESLEKQIASAEAQVANTNVVAPFSGSVESVDFKVGDNTMNLMHGIRIVNLSRLKVSAKLADTYISKVHRGDHVKIVFPDLGNKEIDATLSFVANTINDKRTFDVQAALPASADLRPNMNATLKINDATLPKVFVVNENIVHSSEGQKSLMVLSHEGSKAIARKVVITTGESYGGLVVIKGLKEGDEIITAGYAGINDGEEVKF